MEHSFNTEVAKEVGINAAVILNNIAFWIEKNKANDKNFFDGEYWTYNSAKAFTELFPYMSEKQIKDARKRLREADLIKVGNYNKSAYDKTLWYALTDKARAVLHIGTADRTNLSHREDFGGEPIPYSNTVAKTDTILSANKESKSKSSKLSEQDFLTMCREKFEDEEVIDLLIAWNDNRNLAKKPLTKRALEIALNKLEDCAIQSRLSLTSYLEEVIVKGWLTFYPITNKKPTEQTEHIEFV